MEAIVSRIKTIMEAEGYSAAEFADTLGIGRPLLSHVLSGRNNPSLQLIMKILERFPSYSAGWLIQGSQQTEQSVKPKPPSGELFSEEDTESPYEQAPVVPKSTNSEPEPKNVVNKTDPIRAILFFSDGTFETYNLRH